jgi:hypothetical protein
MKIDRRAFAVLALGAATGLAGCATGGGAAQDEGLEMLFISPMGEPFRAKTPSPYPVDLWFKGADADGDGKLTLAEFQADAERFFKALDLNKDGVVDHREIFYYEHQLVPEILGPNDARLRLAPEGARLILASNLMTAAQSLPGVGGAVMGSGAPPPDQDSARPKPPTGASTVGAAPYGLLFDPEPVRGSDLRLTGRISLNDFRTRAQQRFALLDEDSKGYLTLAGLPETEVERLMPKRVRRRTKA